MATYTARGNEWGDDPQGIHQLSLGTASVNVLTRSLIGNKTSVPYTHITIWQYAQGVQCKMDITMIPKLYLMCLLLMNTLLMCSCMICQDGWVKLSGGEEEERGGDARDPDKDTTRIVPDLCIKINKTPLSWDAALDSCRTELGQLLILDNRYSDTLDMDYQIFDNIMPQVANLLFSHGKMLRPSLIRCACVLSYLK